MADVKWIKIVTDIFDDEKMLLIESLPDADSIMVCWFKLLCLAGKQNNSGVLMLNDRIAYTEEMLATVFRRPLQTVRLALKTFEQFGMVEIINGTITIPNWEKHQNVDRLSELREYNRLAQQRSREKRKALADVNDMSMTCQESQDTDIDIDKIRLDKDKKGRFYPPTVEIDIDKDKRGRFSPPTVEEVADYCKERGNNIDPQAFVDFYTAKGWRVGRDPMKDWKAAVRTWELRDGKKPNPNSKGDFKQNGKINAALINQIKEDFGIEE